MTRGGAETPPLLILPPVLKHVDIRGCTVSCLAKAEAATRLIPASGTMLQITCRTAVARRRRPTMPHSERRARGQRAAGLHLRQLLLRPGPYRDQWERHAHDAPPEEIRQEAVCTVIAEYLYETGEHDESDTRLARTLKDRVSRAVSGRGLSLQTLRWLEAAFRLSPRDAQRIRELY